MRLVSLLILAFVAAEASTQPAQSAVFAGEWFVSGGYGYGDASMRTIDASQNNNVGPPGTGIRLSQQDFAPLVSGDVLYQFTPHFGLGVEVIESQFRFAQTAFTSHDHFYLATARYVFLPERNLNPYIMAGAGVNFFQTSYGSLSTYIIPFNLLLPAAEVGLGVEYSLTTHVVLGTELGALGLAPGVPKPGIYPSSGINWPAAIEPYFRLKLGFDFGGKGQE